VRVRNRFVQRITGAETSRQVGEHNADGAAPILMNDGKVGRYWMTL
jgi:hypothetical protein